MSPQEEILEVSLGDGRVARLVIGVMEEPPPTPNEMIRSRCPSVGELEQITEMLRDRRYTICTK